MINRDQCLSALLLLLALATSVAVALAAFSRNPVSVVVAFALWAALAGAWFGLRARTGFLVRHGLSTGTIDRRLVGVGARHYSLVLLLAVVVAALAWIVAHSSRLVALLGVVGILVCALAIGLVRSSGYRRRQESIVEVTR